MPGLLNKNWMPSLLAWWLTGCALLPAIGSEAVFPSALAQGECRPMAGQRERLLAVNSALARQGLALRVLGCPTLAPASGAPELQVIEVTLWVVDGDLAAETVRGPLADGEEVDMGRAALEPGEEQRPDASDELPPDVLHNRGWLRAAMSSQGFRSVADKWWAFAPT